MNRSMMRLLLAMVCILFFYNTAAAQEPKMYIGINGLFAFENLDTDQTQDKFSGPIDIDFDDSWGIQGRFGYVLNDLFAVEAMAEYIFNFEASGPLGDDDFEARNLFFNGKLTCPAYEKFKPYAALGIGVMNAHEEIESQGKESETSDWGAGFRGALGFDYFFNKNISVGLETAYSLGTGEVDHLEYTTISLGVAYHF